MTHTSDLSDIGGVIIFFAFGTELFGLFLPKFKYLGSNGNGGTDGCC
ncbi:MAG: hypothetical protein R2744_02205 [Bacteroidales bacterium]